VDHAVVDYRGAGADDGLKTGGGLTHSFRFFFLCFSLCLFFCSPLFSFIGGVGMAREKWKGTGMVVRHWGSCGQLFGGVCFGGKPVGNIIMLHGAGAVDSVFSLLVFHHTFDLVGVSHLSIAHTIPILAIELLPRLHSVSFLLFSARTIQR
jgi:hypothetical protein